MWYYIRVYKVLLKLNWERLIVYRANFINNLVASTVWGGFIVISMLLLTSRTPSAFGWTRDEIMLLVGIFTAVMGFFHAIFGRNFEQLSRITNLGLLDSFLVKPVDSQFLVSLSIINFTSLVRVVWGGMLAAYFFSKLDIAFSWHQVIVSLLLLIFGLVLLYSLWMLVIVLTLWFTRLSNLVDLMFSITGMSRFPREMFQSSSELVFLLIAPITFIIVTPTKALLEKATYSDIYGLLFLTCFFFFLSRKFWFFALKFYTSASS